MGKVCYLSFCQISFVMQFIREKCNGIQGYTVVEFHLKTRVNLNRTIQKVKVAKKVVALLLKNFYWYI